MKFDVIITNPPFHDAERRGKTPHKLWIEFTRLALEHLLAEGGVFSQISPASFQSPNSPVLALMKRYRTTAIRLDAGKYFPKVGSTFADYLIYKNARGEQLTQISSGGRSVAVQLNEQLFYIPNDLTPEGMSIHRKVIFRPRVKLPVEWDYVTCHNIRARDGTGTLSRTQTETHRHPIFHTNSQVWWSSVHQDWAGSKKVMWTRSGYTRPFYDPGSLGGTDMAYFVRVESESQGINLAHNLNLALMRYIYETAKWSGFGNERVFASLPDLPRNRRLTDQELFRMFSLTEAEVRHLYQTRLPETGVTRTPSDPLWQHIASRIDEHAFMSGVPRTTDRVSSTAEVFTPTGLVVEMLSSIPLERFAPGRTVLDPACGDGQFLVGAKWVKVLHHGMTETDALADLFGVDLMPDNVALCRRRLGGGRIVVGNMLRPDVAVEGQTTADADFIKAAFGNGLKRPSKPRPAQAHDGRSARERQRSMGERRQAGSGRRRTTSPRVPANARLFA